MSRRVPQARINFKEMAPGKSPARTASPAQTQPPLGSGSVGVHTARRSTGTGFGMRKKRTANAKGPGRCKSEILDAFSYRYRDLGELADLIRFFGRRFSVTNDLAASFESETAAFAYGNYALPKAILPFEFLELTFEDAAETVIPFAILSDDPMSIGDAETHCLAFERISLARTRVYHDEGDFREPNAERTMRWGGLLVAQVLIDGARRSYGLRPLVTAVDGYRFAPPILLLGPSGELNRHDEDNAHEEASTPVGILGYAQAIVARFCEILVHTDVTAQAATSEAISRIERQRVSEMLAVPAAELPISRLSYQLLVRNRTRVRRLSEDLASGRHARYPAAELGSGNPRVRETILRGLGIDDPEEQTSL